MPHPRVTVGGGRGPTHIHSLPASLAGSRSQGRARPPDLGLSEAQPSAVAVCRLDCRWGFCPSEAAECRAVFGPPPTPLTHTSYFLRPRRVAMAFFTRRRCGSSYSRLRRVLASPGAVSALAKEQHRCVDAPTRCPRPRRLLVCSGICKRVLDRWPRKQIRDPGAHGHAPGCTPARSHLHQQESSRQR